MYRELKDLRKKMRTKYLWNNSTKNYLMRRMLKSESFDIYRFMLHLRQYEFFIRQPSTPIIRVLRLWNLRQYQKFAGKCGFVIGDGILGDNITFYHRGNIIINPNARIGNGCKFHGSCCIGNSREGETGCPVLGSNVDIGYGAVLIGDIYIADGIKIGANAVVTKSFLHPILQLPVFLREKFLTDTTHEIISLGKEMWKSLFSPRILGMRTSLRCRVGYLYQLYLKKPAVMSEPNPIQMEPWEYFD